MENKLTVIICPVDRPAYAAEIDNTLQALQEAVGGYIECVPIEFVGFRNGVLGIQTIEGVCCIVDEEGVWKDLPLNHRAVPGGSYYGTAVYVGVSGEDFCSLTKNQMSQIYGLSAQHYYHYLAGREYADMI